MNKFKIQKNLASLLKKPYFSSKMAKDFGISPQLLSYYVSIGKIKRIRRGFYQKVDFQGSVSFQWEDLIEEIYSIPGGVICLISALAIYELTEEMPREHWIAVANETTAKESPQSKIIRYRNMKLGKTTIDLEGAIIPIFDRERCIVDAFRLLLSKETAIKALKLALQLPKLESIDMLKLQAYAKKLRINIIPYLIAITT
jgi:predicted transcriptional regulator of viral defense system